MKENVAMRTTLRAATAALVLAATLAAPGRAADESPRVLPYKAVHSKYGDIGTYINTVSVKDGVTTVQTQVRLRVRVLGITAHREEADRTEIWKDGRLVAFHGVTTTNGDRLEVKGEAKSDAFAITTPFGTSNAPTNIRISNPWSDNFIGATAMMAADSGKVQPVKVDQGEAASAKIGTATLETMRYDIASAPPYQVWLDASHVPVMFNVDDDSGIVTFTLVK